MINNITVAGNLTKDAEIRTSKDGKTAVFNYSIAINESRKVNGEWENYPHFIDVTSFARESKAPKYRDGLKKGVGVVIQGTIAQDRWEYEGKNYSKVFIKSNSVEFLAPKEQKNTPQLSQLHDQYDGEIPF